jgi:PAS domain S-box-containing protein
MKRRLGRWLVPDAIRKWYTLKFGIALLVLALSIGIVGVVGTGEISAEMDDSVDAKFADLAVREGRSLETWHRNNERVVRTMSTAGDVESDDPDTVSTYLQRQQTEHSDAIASIHYVDLANGRVVASTSDGLEGTSLSSIDAPWTDRSSVPDGRVITTDAYRRDGGAPVLAYVTAVDGQTSDATALVVTFKTAAYSQRFGGPGDTYVTVVDDRGRIVFSPGQLSLPAYDDGEAAAEPVARARETAPGAMRTTPSESVRTAMYLEEEQDVVVGYDRVAGTDWVVLVHAPESVASRSVNRITAVGFGATAIAVALIAAFGLVLGRDTAQSIDRLTAKAKQLEQGNYDVDLSTGRIDNLGRLYRAFDAMATALEDRERTLRSQGAMLESERDRLVALFEQETDAVARLSKEPDGLVVRKANGVFDRTFAADAEVPVSDDFEEIIEQPPGSPGLESIVEEAGSSGVEREIAARTADGTREFLFRWIPIGDVTDGEGYAVFTDITDSKERERELKRYESVIQALGDPVYALDENGRYTFVNEATVETFGYEESELRGKHATGVIDESDSQRAQNLIKELLESDDRNSGTLEYEIETADGNRVPVENHVAILKEDGEFIGTAGVIRDVSERQEQERRLRRSENRYRTLVENSPAPIGIVVPDRTVAYCNQAGAEFLGADSRDEIEGKKAISLLHEEDRERASRRFGKVIQERTLAEAVEERFVAQNGTERLAVVTSAPVTYEGQPASMVVLNDVTERKQYERALRSLNDAALQLLNAESESEIAEIVADAAETMIDAEGCAVYLLDSTANRLDPVGFTPGFLDATGGTPVVEVGEESSAVWQAYLNDRRVIVEPDEAGTLPFPPGNGVAGQFLPLGDQGVFAVVSSRSLDEDTEQLVELLAATTEAAFDRLDSEASFRERESLLKRQNERLERQVKINRTIRDVQKTLTRASTREGIERGACQGLSDLDQFRFAWIGEHDPAEDRLSPRVWAGEGQSYLDDVTVNSDHASEPAWETARTGETSVVSSVVEGVHDEPWRKQALSFEFNSVISVPLTYQDYRYGVLTVYAEDSQAFGSLEQTVFEELATTIADAINAVETKQALFDDRALELKLAVDAGESFLGTIARETGGRVEFEGIAGGADETRLFFSVSGADLDRVMDVLEDAVSVADSQMVRESDDGTVFEGTVEGPSFVSTLVDHGGRPRTCVADEDEAEYVVDLPPETNVREFLEMLEDGFPSTELVARRDVERSVGSREELVDTVLGGLTDRQREVLSTAYFAGFFEWPRESTGEDVADMLDVSQPTINRHLRLAQREILRELLSEDVPRVASPKE